MNGVDPSMEPSTKRSSVLQAMASLACALCLLSAVTNGEAYGGERVTEADAIAASNGRARRDGQSLILIAGKKAVELRNGRCLAAPLPERHCTYKFLRYDARNGALVVQANADESYGYLFVRDSDGEIIVLEDEPHLSPDGARFVVVRSCEAPGGSFCGVQLWTAAGPTLVWEHRVETYAEYVFGGWRGNDQVALKVWTHNEQHQLISGLAMLLERGPGNWVIDGPPER
jgi:hypothetical protein